MAAPNEIGTEVSTYLFGRNASDTSLRLSGRSDDLSRVVQVRRQGLFGPTWETIARTEADKGGHGSYRIVDPATFAKKTGLNWDTIVLQSTGGKPKDKVGSRIMYQVKRIPENADGTLRRQFFPDKRDIVQQGDLQADFGGQPRTIEIPLTRPKPGEHFHYAVMLSGYDETAPGTSVQIWTKANGQPEKKKKP